MRSAFWIVIAFLLLSLPTDAQSRFFKQPTFSISVFNHSIGVPGKEFTKLPINLGLSLGVEFSYTDEPIARHAQKFEIGGFTHKHLSRSLWLKSDYIRRFTHKSGVFADLRAGIGYIHDFSYDQTYKLAENGKYQKHTDLGSGGMLFSMGIGTGYRFELNEQFIVSPFIRYEGLIQTPYSKFVPFFPHTLVHIGSKFQIKK